MAWSTRDNLCVKDQWVFVLTPGKPRLTEKKRERVTAAIPLAQGLEKDRISLTGNVRVQIIFKRDKTEYQVSVSARQGAR